MNKVVIVDDHKIIRDGLKLMISFENNFRVVNEYAYGKDCLEKLKEDEPDIIILDMLLPDIHGEEMIPKILNYSKNINIVVLSSIISPKLIKRCMKLGVTGFLNKECSSREFINCLNSVSNSEIYLTKELNTLLIMEKEQESILDALSERELEIFIELVNGTSYNEIGNKYFISPKTVEKHNRNIQQKLGVHSIVDLIKIALKENIIRL